MDKTYFNNIELVIQKVFEAAYYGSAAILSKKDIMELLKIRRLTYDRIYEIQEAARERNLYCIYDGGEKEFIFLAKAHTRRMATRVAIAVINE